MILTKYLELGIRDLMLARVEGLLKNYILFKFVCALTLCWPDGHCETFEGTVAGVLVWPLRGENGFGYDPMFVPDGHAMTFGEMDADAKHAISHRANAFQKLIAACFQT